MNTQKRLAVSAALLLFLVASSALGATRVTIVCPNTAPQLERTAASELAALLKKVFDAEPVVADKAPADGGDVILIGSPATNPAVAKALGKVWPKLSDQGILLKTVTSGDKKLLVIGGGSPAATLWAAYELGHRSGVRYLLQGDFYPPAPRKFEIPDLDVAQEPTARVRAWRAMDESPIGFQSWGLAEQQRLLKQLAKLKFNRVVLSIGATQPFVRYESQGVKNGPLALFQGEHFPIGRDTVGRTAFQGAAEFTNADLAGKKSDDELLSAGKTLVNGVLDAAHSLGMSTGIEIDPSALGANLSKQFVADDHNSLKLASEKVKVAAAKIKASLAAYPTVDALYLSADPKHAPRFLSFLKEAHLLERTGKTPLELNFISVDGSQITPQAGATSAGSQSPVLHLTDESLGVLWQNHTQRLHKILSGLKKEDRGGYLATADLAGDADWSLHYLSRRAYDPAVTPESAGQDLYGAICGKPDAAARLLEAFTSVEKANDLIEEKMPKLGVTPRPGMLKAARDGKLPDAAVADALKEYSHADDEVYRAHDSCQPAGRKYLFYYAKRGEFAIYYMSCIDALAKAAAAGRDGKEETRDEQLQTAAESMYNAIECMREINRDQSDRACIAVLNKFAYAPLANQSDEK